VKVAVYHSNNDLRIEERPVPLISENELLVRMRASGICGTDVLEWYRRMKAPRVLGHEMAGEIAETGAKVEGFKKGDRVFVSHHVPCYKCRDCGEGKYTACESLHRGNYEPGGFSEYIRVPEENVRYGTFKLPDGMSYEEGAMIEPLACALLGQKKISIKKGDTVLVLGAGISGLLHIQLAKLKGASVIATDVNEYRMRKAREYGANTVFNAKDYSPEKLKEANEGRLADRVIVCAGAKEAISQAVSSVDKQGAILFFAVPREDICVPSLNFWRNEITVTFSYGAAPYDLNEAIRLMETGSVDVQGMITHRLPLSRIGEGFSLVSQAGESLKVVIVPD
jgi:L-iditol 2-dehydrogenase